MATISVAVIIPTLDEAETLQRILPELVTAADEVIVSDGGSRDGTVRSAVELGVVVVQGKAGRGPQLNRGAHTSTSEVLLFLHADTTLPTGAIEKVRRAVEEGFVGGGFAARFDDPRWQYRFGSAFVSLRTRISRAPLGDQAQFAARSVFEELGGFRDWPILEDLDFIRRLRHRGRVAILPDQVVTSARRYVEGGIIHTLLTNWLIWVLFLVGVSPHRLAQLYKQVR